MKTELFKTKEDIKEALANFKSLKQVVGWQLVVEIVEANIEILTKQILEGTEDATKEQTDRKRDKLKAYKDVIGTPDFWIEKLSQPEPFKEQDDPYHTVDSLKTSRN